MKVSIIVPIYNAEKSLERALTSALNQTYKNIELILVNDGSTDKSLEICKIFKEKDRRIKIINIQNSGPGVARNKALEIIKGDYISFLDADDYLKEDFLEESLKIAVENSYEIVATNHFYVNKDIKISKNNYRSGKINRFGTKEEIKRYNLFKTSSSFGYVWGKLYKTSFIKKHKITFSEERQVFLEDTLFNLKAISYRPKYFILNEAFYYYNIYEDSLSNKKGDITNEAINLIESYEKFLNDENKYKENLDLFVPLITRVISWSLFKTLDYKFEFKNLYKKVICFSRNNTIRRVLIKEDSFKEIFKINNILQSFLYGLIIISIRYNFEKALSLIFYINHQIFKLYVKKSLNK